MDLGVKEKTNIDIRATVDVLEFEAIPTILRHSTAKGQPEH